MQNGFLKSLIPLAIVILIVSLVLVVISQLEPIPNYTIDTISSACFSEPHDIAISAEKSSIAIVVFMVTPNPCYSASGIVNFTDKEIDVELIPLPKQGVCIQCIGKVTGKVVIQNLTKGAYGIKVKTPDKAQMTTIMIE